MFHDQSILQCFLSPHSPTRQLTDCRLTDLHPPSTCIKKARVKQRPRSLSQKSYRTPPAQRKPPAKCHLSNGLLARPTRWSSVNHPPKQQRNAAGSKQHKPSTALSFWHRATTSRLPSASACTKSMIRSSKRRTESSTTSATRHSPAT